MKPDSLEIIGGIIGLFGLFTLTLGLVVTLGHSPVKGLPVMGAGFVLMYLSTTFRQ